MDALKRGIFYNGLLLILFIIHAVSGEQGHCIWYGECENSGMGRKNCAYNGTAKPLYDPTALETLQQYCPDLYTGNGSRTCCSPSQLTTLKSNMAIPIQLLSRCPSCYHNFLKLFCYSTCNPHHSDSIHVKRYTTFEEKSSVDSIDYVVSKDYAFGMFNSCRNVQMPSANARALDVLCGRLAAQCTPYNWLAFMGSTASGHTPFEITFYIQNDPWSPKDMEKKYQPMNATTTPCYEKYGTQPPCSCPDCFNNCTKYSYPPDSWPFYRLEQITVRRTGNHSDVIHHLPPPSVGTMNFTSIFDKKFLHDLLDLQLQIMNITAKHNHHTVTLEDVCSKPFFLENKKCAIESVLEYWQNNHTNIDKKAWDEYHFYVLADYLDHFEYCTRNPYAYNDTTGLFMSCRGTGGTGVVPWNMMSGYDGLYVRSTAKVIYGREKLRKKEKPGKNYHNSTAFVITFILNSYLNETMNEPAEAWESELINFMKNYSNPEMNVTFTTQVPPGRNGLIQQHALSEDLMDKYNVVIHEEPTLDKSVNVMLASARNSVNGPCIKGTCISSNASSKNSSFLLYTLLAVFAYILLS